jgi:peptidoglycan/xylan/chitin deacetylase (PgdA/CDA1 family)
MEAIGMFGHMLLGGAATAAVLYTIGADRWATHSKDTVRRGAADRQAVALTFDDGPDPVFTPRVLDILAQFGVRATFFVIGKQAEQHPEIIRAIAGAGHEVGNHTYGHRALWLLPPHRTREEIDRCTHVLTAILGAPPWYFRPPWGQFNWEAVRHSTRVQQRRVLWSLRGEGWLPVAKPQTIGRIVARRLHPGAIIDLHDGGGLKHTPARMTTALPELLWLIQQRGYRCLTLSELLTEGPTARSTTTLASRLWDWYEAAWNAWYGVENLGQETVLTLSRGLHYGPDHIMDDGTMIRSGVQIGELHLDRARVAHLHRSIAQPRLGFALRRELIHTLQRLARMVVEHPHYHGLEAFRSTTLFWKEATRLGFEVCGGDSPCHHRFVSWYQRMLLARDHPLGCRRLRGRHLEARTVWLSRQELLRRYGGPRR